MTRPDLDDCGCLIIRCDCGRRLGTDDAPPSRDCCDACEAEREDLERVRRTATETETNNERRQ